MAPASAGGRRAARDDPLEPHPSTLRIRRAQPARASAASIARRVYTTAIAERYSRVGVDVGS